MVHARLPILGGEDGVPLSKLDLVPLLQSDKLPPHKGIVVGVGICGDEGTPPVHLKGGRREVRGGRKKEEGGEGREEGKGGEGRKGRKDKREDATRSLPLGLA